MLPCLNLGWTGFKRIIECRKNYWNFGADLALSFYTKKSRRKKAKSPATPTYVPYIVWHNPRQHDTDVLCCSPRCSMQHNTRNHVHLTHFRSHDKINEIDLDSLNFYILFWFDQYECVKGACQGRSDNVALTWWQYKCRSNTTLIVAISKTLSVLLYPASVSGIMGSTFGLVKRRVHILSKLILNNKCDLKRNEIWKTFRMYVLVKMHLQE